LGLLIGSDLLLELANGVLVDIEAYINCQNCAPRAAVFVAVLFNRHPHRRRMDHRQHLLRAAYSATKRHNYVTSIGPSAAKAVA
jgi:hypothetical protein